MTPAARADAVAATYAALDRLNAALPPRGDWTFGDGTVRWAARVVDGMGVLAQLDAWSAERQRGPGGAPEKFSRRALLIAMVLAGREGKPMLASMFRDILFKHLSPAMRLELGVPAPPADGDVKGWLARYKNVRDRLHGLLGVMDPSPYPKNRRRTPEEFEARTKDLSPEEITVLYERLSWFANQILEASVREFPRELRRRWKGSVGVDSTAVPAFARPAKRARGGQRNKSRKVETHSTDPDAAWYVREHDHRDPDPPEDLKTIGGKRLSKVNWAMEATLVVAGRDEPDEARSFPFLVVGMAVLHKPGYAVGEQATEALTSIHNRQHPANWLGGDRAYSNSQPEKFQLPARALGYKMVFDYREDQLGVHTSHAGALQIEGAWYCPSILPSLVNATIDFRKGQITEAVYAQRIEARRAYLFRPKAAPDEEGHLRLLCPAASGAPTARCDLKPASITHHKTAGKTRILVSSDVAQDPPKVCTQQSVTFPPTAGAKFAQELHYGSQEHAAVYASLRNTIEGFNGIAKDGAYESLGDSTRRRIRGVAAQTVFVAFLLFGANLRKIDKFRELGVVDHNGVIRLPKKRRRRKTASLADHLPAGVHSGDPPATG